MADTLITGSEFVLALSMINRWGATKVADYIKEFISHKVGNYFIYVPSYEYLQMLVPLLQSENYELLVQEKDMSEIEKEMFLSCFVDKPKKTMLGVAVLGGAFSEGIDLVGERIIGVAIVGVGIPQNCFERDIIRNYFDKTEKKGYEYAYISPGINKVMQALGRVIRSATISSMTEQTKAVSPRRR